MGQKRDAGERASGSRLERALRRWRASPSSAGGPTPARGAVDLSPATAFEALLQERLRSVEAGVEDLKGRVNGLIFLVVGAVIVQVVLGLLQ